MARFLGDDLNSIPDAPHREPLIGEMHRSVEFAANERATQSKVRKGVGHEIVRIYSESNEGSQEGLTGND